jgi:ABC-2 type transport system permease protein
MSLNIKGWLALVFFLTKRTLINKKMVIVGVSALLPSFLVIYANSQGLDMNAEAFAGMLEIFVLTFFLLFIPLIYGSSILGSDIENNSIILILTSPLNRPLVYLGYLVSLLITVILAMFIITSVGSLTFFLLVGVETVTFDIYINVFALTIIGSIVYSSLYLTMSLITNKVIYFGLFYAFIWEGFIGFFPGAISDFTIRHYIRSIGSSWIEYSGLGVFEGSDVQTSFLVLITLTVGLVVLGSYLLHVKEMN